MNNDLNDLLKSAKDDGALTGDGLVALNLNDLGDQIRAGMGVSVDDVQTSDVIGLVLVIDDSTSMRDNAQAARDGVNGVLEALAATKQKNSIYVYCILLNHGLLYPFSPLITGKGVLDEKLKLTAKNYAPSGLTPLFDVSTVALGTAAAKCQEFSNAGVPARMITLILTDGANCGGKKQQPEEVAPIVNDLTRSEVYMILGFGIDDGYTDFTDVFVRMGLSRNSVLTSKSASSDIRAKFALVSQSAVRGSQAASGAGFSKVVAGGFGG